MKLLFISLIVLCSSVYSFSQNKSKNCDLFQRTIKLYNENAIWPIDPDIFDITKFQDDFLLSIDPNSIILTADDLKLFDLIQQSIKNDYHSSYCAIENDLINICKKNIESTIKTFEKLKMVNFDFNEPDSIYIGSGSVQQIYDLDKEIRCKKYVKSIIIRNILESTPKFESLARNRTELISCIDSIKIKKIEKEIENLKDILDPPNEFPKVLFNSYFNSFINQYDPYSYLFSNDIYNNFKEQLSSYSGYFGFQLETNKQGEIIIASVIPGSTAWKIGMINPGDKVLKLEIENKASINAEQSQLTEIIDFISGISTEKLIITLLKADNNIKIISLYREKLENIENSVQSFILQGENKVGYIILPAFYTSWEGQNKFGCAQDVGRAIYFLMKENIESLIIDLRNNTGGSMFEAIDLAGIFVDYGTLSVAMDKNNEFTSIKDFNRGTLYSGPLALLVNSNSASASEMVAAVLQDYNRAIIIGDTTFGKSTGQILLPVDKENNNILKITTNKYYRVTGETYNSKGVIPDIPLPYYNKNTSDKKINQFSNSTDTINKKTFYKPLTVIPGEKLTENSLSRIIGNTKFQRLHTIDSIYSNLAIQNNYLPLNFDNYYKLIEQKEMIDIQIDYLMNLRSDFFTIELLPKDKEMIKINKYYSDVYDQSMKTILTDPYIEETLKILTDYINLKKN